MATMLLPTLNNPEFLYYSSNVHSHGERNEARLSSKVIDMVKKKYTIKPSSPL